MVSRELLSAGTVEVVLPPEASVTLDRLKVIFLEDFLAGLPPIRRIEHHIDPVHRTTVPYRPVYRLNPEEVINLERPVRDSMIISHVRERLNAFTRPVLTKPPNDESWHMSIDYRELSDMLDVLSRATIITTINLERGYTKVRMKDGVEREQAVHEWLGPTYTPDAFTRLVNRDFRTNVCKFVVVYYDDILSHYGSLLSFIMHLELVCEFLRKEGYHANLKTCTRYADRLVFLGLVVSSQDIQVIVEKIVTSDDPIARRPSSFGILRDGLTSPSINNAPNYHIRASSNHRFRQDFSPTATYPAMLIKLDVPIMWENAQDPTFEDQNTELMLLSDRPLRVIKPVHRDAYYLDDSGKYETWITFSVINLECWHAQEEEMLRSTSSQEGENDEDIANKDEDIGSNPEPDDPLSESQANSWGLIGSRDKFHEYAQVPILRPLGQPGSESIEPMIDRPIHESIIPMIDKSAHPADPTLGSSIMQSIVRTIDPIIDRPSHPSVIPMIDKSVRKIDPSIISTLEHPGLPNDPAFAQIVGQSAHQSIFPMIDPSIRPGLPNDPAFDPIIGQLIHESIVPAIDPSVQPIDHLTERLAKSDHRTLHSFSHSPGFIPQGFPDMVFNEVMFRWLAPLDLANPKSRWTLRATFPTGHDHQVNQTIRPDTWRSRVRRSTVVYKDPRTFHKWPS